MNKAYKSFILTAEQEKIVLPEIKKAERAYDKEGKPGIVFSQMMRFDRCGDIHASVVFVGKKWADKFIKLREEYDESLAKRGKK